MKRTSRSNAASHASGLVVAALVSGCTVQDVPATASSCDYRCVSVCPPGFVCRDGYCVRPDFVDTCTPDEVREVNDPPEAPACLPGEGLLTISPVASLQACTEQEVSVSLEVSGGEGPFQWFAASLAPGLVLEQDATRRAVVRGTLREVGSFDIRIGVRDARSCASLDLPLSVTQVPRITTVWPDACVGAPFELALTAEGGDPSTYAWSYDGTASLERDGAALYGRAPSEPGQYPVRLTLRDGVCPIASAEPTVLTSLWTVRAPGECPHIVTAELPPPCEGVPYSQALVASDGSGSGYVWSALSSQLPSGLELDLARGLVSGTPTGATRTGFVELLLEDSLGQRATARIDLSLRDDCRMAWIADEPARLHVGDVFLSSELVLPAVLGPGARVLDLKFSPDGAWVAFRAGAPGVEGVQLHSMRDAAAADVAVDFACPEADTCAVLDYAWSQSSQHLAVVLGDGQTRDFVSGVTLASGGPPVPWPVLGTALSNVTEAPLDYLRDLSWAPGDSFGFVGASSADGPPQTVFLAQAGLPATPRSIPYYDDDLRLRQTPTGWVAFDGFYYTATALIPPDGVALHVTAWTSPSGEYAGSIRDGQLSIYAMDDALTSLATTPPGSCAVVAAWAPQANDVERILCSGGSLDAPDGAALRIFDFFVATGAFDPPAGREVPLNGALRPALLTNTRRFFPASADSLVVGAPERGVSVLPVPLGTPNLPRDSSVLSAKAPAEMRFSPNGRSLLVYDRDGLLSLPMPRSPFQSNLSIDAAGSPMLPLNLATCEEALWASPDNWCGAPAALGHFIISADSSSVLFEASGELWVTDLGINHDRPARRVAALPVSCGSSCVTRSYDFAP